MVMDVAFGRLKTPEEIDVILFVDSDISISFTEEKVLKTSDGNLLILFPYA